MVDLPVGIDYTVNKNCCMLFLTNMEYYKTGNKHKCTNRDTGDPGQESYRQNYQKYLKGKITLKKSIFFGMTEGLVALAT